MFNKSLTILISSTFSNLLAQVNDEKLLYSLLEVNKIVLQALRYERDHGPDANEQKAIIARLCELSLTNESSSPKIEKVLATINKDKKEFENKDKTNFEPGQPTSTSRQQVLSYWYEQAAAPAATKSLIAAWNAFYEKNSKSDDKDLDNEGIAFVPVASYEDRVKAISAKALCEGILSDDKELKAKCLAILSERVLNNSNPEIALFTRALSTLNTDAHDRKQEAKSLNQTENNEDLLQRAANTGDRDSQLKLYSLILQEKTKLPRSYLQKKEALKELLANALGEDSSELAKTLLNAYFVDNATRSALLRPILLAGGGGLDFAVLGSDQSILFEALEKANLIDFIKQQPIGSTESLPARRQRIAQLFPLQDLCNTAAEVANNYQQSNFNVDFSLVSTVFLLLHGVVNPELKQDIPLAEHLLTNMKESNVDAIKIYAEFLEAYAFEHIYQERDLIAAFELYEKIAHAYSANGDAIVSGLIKASQARLESFFKLKKFSADLKRVGEHVAILLAKRMGELWQSPQRDWGRLGELFEQFKEYGPADPMTNLFLGMRHEAHGLHERAFKEYLQVSKNQKSPLNFQIFVAVALAKLGQQYGYTINQSAKDSADSKYSHLIPMIKTHLSQIKQANLSQVRDYRSDLQGQGSTGNGITLKSSIFNENRSCRIEGEALQFVMRFMWNLKKPPIEAVHQTLLGEEPSLAEMKKWIELCATMFVFGGSCCQPGWDEHTTWNWDGLATDYLKGWFGREERQFWKKCWSEMLVRMYSEVSASNNKYLVDAWDKICKQAENSSIDDDYHWPPTLLVNHQEYGRECWNEHKEQVKVFLKTHPVIRFSRARVLENKPKTNAHKINPFSPYFLQFKPLNKAKEIYQQLAKENEPRALERLAALSDKKDFQASKHLARAYLLVNPDCKSGTNYIIKPSMKELAGYTADGAQKEQRENTPYGSAAAEEVYAVHLAEELQRWHNGIPDNSEHQAQKMFAGFLMVLTNKRFAIGAEFHQELASNLDVASAPALFRSVVDQLCKFIVSNSNLITAEHVNDLRSIWHKLKPVENRIDSIQRSGGENLWADTSKQFNAALKRVPTQKAMPSDTKKAESLHEFKREYKDASHAGGMQHDASTVDGALSTRDNLAAFDGGGNNNSVIIHGPVSTASGGASDDTSILVTPQFQAAISTNQPYTDNPADVRPNENPGELANTQKDNLNIEDMLGLEWPSVSNSPPASTSVPNSKRG